MNGAHLVEIPVECIDRDPAQPRQYFDEVELAGLAESIRAHGVIQPVEVEATGDGRYRLHHGERRLRASRLAGRATIPAVVAPPRTADEALVRGLIENLHRADLNPIEEARVFARLIEMGWPRSRIARETGRAMSVIASRLEWLQMEPEIQRLVALGHLPRDGRLSVKMRVLPPEVRVSLAEKLAARGVGLKGCVAAAERAAEAIARRAEAEAAGRARHAATVERAGRPGERANGHDRPRAVPMLATAGSGGNGAVITVVDAAAAMCAACYLRPKGEVIPAWEIVEAAARATCAACERRDGPAIPEVCRECPGVAMVRALLAGVGRDNQGDDR